MNWSLSFEPLLSWIWIAAIMVPVALLVFASLFLRMRGSFLRVAALAALGIALANPVLLDEEREPLQSVVALVVDRSQSQDIGDRMATTDAAVEELRARLSRFPQFDVRVVEAGRADAADDRTQTRLFHEIDSAFRDVPPSRVAGAIMVTDGQVHDVPADPGSISAPLHVLVTGEEGEFDRRIRFERAPRFGIVGKPVEMTYRVISNDGQTGTVPVEVRINGNFVVNREARIGQPMTMNIVVPNAGKNIVELTIPTAPGELTGTNNRTIAVLDGIRENLRVLLVSGEPHAGERTWRNLLKSDASVDLVHFTILRPPEKQDGTPIHELSLIAFPTRELFVERVNDFDLIIFDRYQHRDVLPILYYDYIAEYVENGGALLIAAGPEYAGNQSIARTPLISALPALPTGTVIEEGFYPRLTEDGERHPVTRGLEGSASEPPQWSRWFRLIDIQQPEGHVVLQGADRPLLVLDRKGDGRVGMLLSDQGWLWARGFEGGGPHVSLYRRIAHWLMKEPELEEERLTASGRGMTLDIIRQTMSDDPGPASVLTPSGRRIDVNLASSEPGLFTGSLEVDEIGLYQIANGDLTALAHVGPVNAPEFQDTVSTTEVLQPAADASGGSVRRLGQTLTGNVSVPGIVPVRTGAVASGRDWIGLRTTNDSVLKSVSRVPLFAGFFGLAALLLAFGAMWYREGR
ncbi:MULTISPECIES: membrane protein [unclassified Aminobacter]|uniref:membrane protein n=1 Tax=unclassified Aminobacter TaxID=2644704 RepID=UPI0004652FD4|nr:MULTISPECIES: membrane protein [unclassified Aminobacter]TWG61118.1 hypothetical protein L610_002400000670 [Aminobacter sp. J44]TWH31667.1 hypothetical protein L611_002400000020 [Aminobacter sp. J15]